MKRITIAILLLMFSFTLTACDLFGTRTTSSNDTTTSTTTVLPTTSSSSGTTTTLATTVLPTGLDLFLFAADNTSNAVIYGYAYDKTQEIGGIFVYSHQMETRVVSYGSLLARTTVMEMTLADFESENQFDTVGYDLYYNETGTIKVEGDIETQTDLVWQTIAPEIDLDLILNEDVLSDWTIMGITLIGSISDEDASAIFDVPVTNMEIEIIISSNLLSFVAIRYNIDGYQFTINQTYIYDPYDVSIMNGYTNS